MIKNAANIEDTATTMHNELKRNASSYLYSMGKKYYIHPRDYLTTEQVEGLFKACEKAYTQGHPLNRFITIHYDDYADTKKPQKFVINILEHSRKWLQRRNLPVAYIYVLESGKHKGIHTHILIHIPPNYQMEYKRTLRQWLPFEWTKQRVNVKTIKYPSFGNLHHLNSIYGILRYICKGIDPSVSIRGIKPQYQGEIYGQRYGISLSLR